MIPATAVIILEGLIDEGIDVFDGMMIMAQTRTIITEMRNNGERTIDIEQWLLKKIGR